MSGNDENCPFCNSDHRDIKTHQVAVEEIMKRVEVNDAVAIYVMGNYYDVEVEVCSRIWKKQWNCMLGQQNLIIVRCIIIWLEFMMTGEI